MTEAAPPLWVTKRDGRTEPFDADRVSRALFAATESIGKGDAFLARELADGVVHFLADGGGATTTSERVADVVAQVVRELGHPALARAFVERPKRRDERPRAGLYSRDIAAAAEAGLIVLAGADTPDEFAGCVLNDMDHAHRLAGQYVAMDSPEYLPQADVGERRGVSPPVMVVNLNVATPPPWAASLADGPLFAAPATPRRKSADLLAEMPPEWRVEWHLSEKDFADRESLLLVIRRALAGSAIGFSFDRPRRPVSLAEGLSRDRPAALLVVGLNLVTLTGQPGLLADSERFLVRLGSLARMALSAAVQKRAYLRTRRGGDVTSGFLLDRARLVAVPIGLDEVVRRFTGWGMSNGGESLVFGRRIVRRLAEVLRDDGRRAQVEATLDGPFSFTLEGAEGVAGVTPWDAMASPRSQLRAACEYGTLALFVGDATPEQVAELLETAFRQTDAVRVRLLRAPS